MFTLVLAVVNELKLTVNETGVILLYSPDCKNCHIASQLLESIERDFKYVRFGRYNCGLHFQECEEIFGVSKLPVVIY